MSKSENEVEMNQSAYEEIFKIHSQHLDFSTTDSSPLLVTFSAIPGSGKSELSRRLAKDYGFLRISNKDIREAVEKTGHTSDVAIGDYTLWLLDKLTENKPSSIVFDRNIDQWYGPARQWATRKGYKFIVVRIEVSRMQLERRLHKRERGSAAKVLDSLDFYSEQHKKISMNMQTDILLKEDYDLDTAASRIAAFL